MQGRSESTRLQNPRFGEWKAETRNGERRSPFPVRRSRCSPFRLRMPAMDSLDRMYRHLVRTVRTKFPQYLTHPFDVAELHQNILPYRHHRRELGLETNEDYEIVLTELLAGAREYLIVDDRMRDALRAELASTNPDPSAFKKFATASVALSPAAVRSLSIGPDEELSRTTAPSPAITPAAERPARPSAETTKPATPPAPATAGSPTTPAPEPAITPRAVVPQAGERCRACNEVLPAGRAMTFCPHCGQNITTMNCPACGSELEVGWKFCPTCGRPAGAT
jgi:Double zinc ribbon